MLVYLSDRANATHRAWPHLPTIARQTGLHRRTIIRATERLEALGLITVERKPGCSNRYIIHTSKDARAGDTKSPVTPRHVTGDTTPPPPVTPRHQHPNHQGTHKGNGQPSPRFKRENWQLLKDEKALRDRLEAERESCKPDPQLIESLKASLRAVRTEMKGIS